MFGAHLERNDVARAFFQYLRGRRQSGMIRMLRCDVCMRIETYVQLQSDVFWVEFDVTALD